MPRLSKIYCTRCHTAHERGACERKRPDHRPSPSLRGYDRRWQKIRGMVLAESPLCADPHGTHAERGEVVLATEVHHIRPLRDGGTHRRSNLMPLCKSCHSKITARGGGV